MTGFRRYRGVEGDLCCEGEEVFCGDEGGHLCGRDVDLGAGLEVGPN